MNNLLQQMEEIAWYTLPHPMVKVEGIDKEGVKYKAREENIVELITKAYEQGRKDMGEEILGEIENYL